MSTSSAVEPSATSAELSPDDPLGTHTHRPPPRRLRLDRYVLLVAFAIAIAAFGAYEPSTFLSIGNLSNILGSQSVLFVLVLAVLLPSVMGDFDLSLGASAGLASMMLAVLNVQHGVPVLVAALAGVGAAVLVGIFNAIFVVWFRNDPFIVTLGTMTIVGSGVIYVLSGNNDIGVVSLSLSNWIFTNNFLDIPLEFYYALALFLIIWYVLSYTPIGQKALVVGQSREVARLSGVKVDKMRAWGYIIASVIAAIAGIFYAGTQGTVDPTAGSTYILPAYAAVFLGATAFKPGRINPLGAFFAVYLLATVGAGLQLAGAQEYVQEIFYGGALVIAITAPKIRGQRVRRRSLVH